MKIERCIKESFVVIGKEGSTNDGPGFIENLWSEANGHFNEVADLAKRDEDGKLLGIWGAINLMEGYGNDNPGAKSQGMKQLMAGGGVALIGTTLVPLLANLFG